MNQLVHPPATPSGPWSLPLAPAQERFNDRNPKGGDSGRRLTPAN
jgi:hypothetical protein